MIAAVSAHESKAVLAALEATDFATVVVGDARHAEKELMANGTCVLVIDSGLMEAPHDGQWRSFRARHPRLCAVVRRLTTRQHPSLPPDDTTRLVQPDDDSALQHAIRGLAARPLRL